MLKQSALFLFHAIGARQAIHGIYTRKSGSGARCDLPLRTIEPLRIRLQSANYATVPPIVRRFDPLPPCRMPVRQYGRPVASAAPEIGRRGNRFRKLSATLA
jgi:hypothetical protein